MFPETSEMESAICDMKKGYKVSCVKTFFS